MAESAYLQNTLSKTQLVERMFDELRQQPDTDQKGFALQVQESVEAKRVTVVPILQPQEAQTYIIRAYADHNRAYTDYIYREKDEDDDFLLAEEHNHTDEFQDSEDKEQNNSALSSQDAESDKGQRIDITG